MEKLTAEKALKALAKAAVDECEDLDLIDLIYKMLTKANG